MTNRIAILLALVIVGMVVLDMLLTDSANLLFLGKKMFELIDWMAFWR